jgi:hypothetical protein
MRQGLQVTKLFIMHFSPASCSFVPFHFISYEILIYLFGRGREINEVLFTIRGSNHDRGKIFPFSPASRPVLGPNQPPIQRVPGAISPETKQPGCEADQSPCILPRSRMMELYDHSIPPFLFMARC